MRQQTIIWVNLIEIFRSTNLSILIKATLV